MPAFEIIPQDMQSYFFANKLNHVKNIINTWQEPNKAPFNTKNTAKNKLTVFNADNKCDSKFFF